MDEDGRAVEWHSKPDVLRRLLERLGRFPLLPPATRSLRSLGPGSRTPDVDPTAEREPATDVIEGVNMVYVTVDLPGVTRRDIDLRATESALTVVANSSSRKYFREIPLPAAVQVDTIQATYKNGVLDVSLEKKERRWHIPVT